MVGTPHFPIVYVVYGPGGVPLARAVVRRGEPCPALMPQGDAFAQLLKNVSVELRAEGTDSLPFAFPVRVCEAALPRELPANSATFGGRQLPAITRSPSKYTMLGDTGLRVKPKNVGTCARFSHEMLYGIRQCVETIPFSPDLVEGSYQAVAEWPLESITDRAAEGRPDVVIHVGDFLYRQGPCARGEGCEDINNAADISLPGEWGDNWNGWWADFFEPSAALLQAAPWIVLRGNHESCPRGGHGFFMFLDPRPLPENWTADYCIERTDMYQIPFENEQFLVVDDNFLKDANIDSHDYMGCPSPNGAAQSWAVEAISSMLSSADEPMQEEVEYFAAQFRAVEVASQSHAANIYLGHHPLLAVICYEGHYTSLSPTLQQALAANPAMLDRISLVIHGHVHFFQGLVFEDHSLPASLIVGNGGTKLLDLEFENHAALDGAAAFGGTRVQTSFSADAFGFSTMRRSATSGSFDVESFHVPGNVARASSSIWAVSLPAVRGLRHGGRVGRAVPPQPWHQRFMPSKLPVLTVVALIYVMVVARSVVVMAKVDATLKVGARQGSAAAGAKGLCYDPSAPLLQEAPRVEVQLSEPKGV